MSLDHSRRFDAFWIIEVYPRETCSGNFLRIIGTVSDSADCRGYHKSTTESEPSSKVLTVREKRLTGFR